MADVVVPDWLTSSPASFLAASSPGWLVPRPVLVDSGFGRDLHSTLGLLPGEPATLFNTHWHSDHVGGNAGLAERLPDANRLLGSPGLARQCRQSQVGSCR